MKNFRKPLLIGVGMLAALAVLAAGAWIYIVSTVEQPKYAVLQQSGSIEIRDYPSMIVAEVTRQGDRGSAVRAGFSPLAGYIFAKNRKGDTVSMTAPVMQDRQAIAMTAPVTQTPANAGTELWRVRFVMPAKYTLASLPETGGNDVRLLEVPAARRAAIRFSGVATDSLIASNEATLRAWLAARGMTISGVATYAYYNDPFTPGPLRRNEVMFDLQGF